MHRSHFAIFLSLFLLSCASTEKPQLVEDKIDRSSMLQDLTKFKSGEYVDFRKHCQQDQLLACLLAGESRTYPKRLSVMQSATSDVEAVFNFVTHGEQEVEVLVWNEKGKAFSESWMQVPIGEYAKDDYRQVRHFKVSSLRPGESFHLAFFTKKGKLLDYRRFKTFDESEKSLRFLIASCLNDDLPEVAHEMWMQVEKENLELVLLIGDNVYGDTWKGEYLRGETPPYNLYVRYLEGRENIPYYSHRELKPTLATWDDHDYGVNNGGKDYSHKEEARDIFRTMFPQHLGESVTTGPGVASKIELLGQRFVFLDGRSFRDGPEDKNGHHLGDDQMKWVLKNADGGYPNWLIMGDQFFGAYHRFESWERYHPKTLKQFLAGLRKLQAPSLFVSGDRHLSELMALEPKLIGYPSYEVTSSAIHSKVYPGSFEREPNPRQLEGIDGTYNYIVVDSTRTDNGLLINFFAKGLGQKVIFTRTVHLRK